MPAIVTMYCLVTGLRGGWPVAAVVRRGWRGGQAAQRIRRDRHRRYCQPVVVLRVPGEGVGAMVEAFSRKVIAHVDEIHAAGCHSASTSLQDRGARGPAIYRRGVCADRDHSVFDHAIDTANSSAAAPTNPENF